MTPFMICGPTGSGKSKYAIQLAQKIGGIIVNADSMQIYKDMPLISAQPSLEDLRKVPHHLYGYVDPQQSFSVAKWLNDVKKILEENTYTPLIFVGGTGLYTKALLEGLSDMPPISERVRRDVLETLETFSPQILFTILQKEDPAAALKIDPNNTRRVARALEVKRQTGRSILDFQDKRRKILGTPAKVILIQPDRPALHEAINSRVDRMMSEGAIEEVSRLKNTPLSQTAAKTIGYQEISAHLEGHMTKEEMCEKIKTRTRQFAKRQTTWFQNQLRPNVTWPSLFSEAETSPFLLKVLE